MDDLSSLNCIPHFQCDAWTWTMLLLLFFFFLIQLVAFVLVAPDQVFIEMETHDWHMLPHRSASTHVNQHLTVNILWNDFDSVLCILIRILISEMHRNMCGLFGSDTEKWCVSSENRCLHFQRGYNVIDFWQPNIDPGQIHLSHTKTKRIPFNFYCTWNQSSHELNSTVYFD